jgi:hypothetical protein
MLHWVNKNISTGSGGRYILYPHQINSLVSASKRKIYEWPKQTGKTDALLIEALYLLDTNKNEDILFISQSESTYKKALERFLELIIDSTPLANKLTMSDSGVIINRNTIDFTYDGNDERLSPGYSCTTIMVDDAEYCGEDVWTDVVGPIVLTTPSINLILSTTSPCFSKPAWVQGLYQNYSKAIYRKGENV